VNSVAPEQLAAICARRGVRLLCFSSDLVFDGRSSRPYVESDAVAPLSA
jgi:dTDP-4-dehydrorhamnose reductase